MSIISILDYQSNVNYWWNILCVAFIAFSVRLIQFADCHIVLKSRKTINVIRLQFREAGKLGSKFISSPRESGVYSIPFEYTRAECEMNLRISFAPAAWAMFNSWDTSQPRYSFPASGGCCVICVSRMLHRRWHWR